MGKYVVGRQNFVDRQLVDKFLSKNFRRHDTLSTQQFVDKHFVENFLSTRHFVDTVVGRQAFRRQNISSTRHFVDTTVRRHLHVQVEELLRVLNFSEFQLSNFYKSWGWGWRRKSQSLNIQSKGEGEGFKAWAYYLEGEGEGENLLLELTNSALVEYSVDKMFCRQNVLSTKCPVDEVSCRRSVRSTKICRQNVVPTKCSVDEMLFYKILSTKCFDKNFVDEMLFDKSVIRRKT